MIDYSVMSRFVINKKLSALFDRMNSRSSLDESDRYHAFNLPVTRKIFATSGYIIRHGDKSDFVALLLDGFCYGQKYAGDGKSQIISLGIPGDMIGLESLLLQTADYDVRALTAVDVAMVPLAAVQQLALRRPAIGHALGIHQAINHSISREWLLNLGARDGLRRISHFLCEFAFRMDAQSPVPGQTYELPMSQEQIGQATGLTAVHVNRMLKTLHAAGLIERSWRNVRFPSWEKLREIGDFSTGYLHPGKQVQLPASTD